MKLDDVVERLTSCGLGEKEARAFVHLTNLGRSKVTDIAKNADLKRAETYQLLERLQGRGLVEASLARPRTYAAVAPERAMEILVEERSRELRSVEDMQEDIRERLEALGAAHAEPASASFRVLSDHNQIRGQLKRTIHKAKRELCAVASGRSLFRLLLDENLEEELVAAKEKGVTLRILTEVTGGQEAEAERLAQLADVRHAMVPRPLRFFLADETEVVQYVTADALVGGAKETALWIGAADHVQVQRAFFDDLWQAGVPLAERLEELRTGRAPPQASVVRGRLTRFEKQKEMLLRARQDVLLVVDSDEAARLAKAGLTRALASRARDGVRVRVLADEAADVPAMEGVEVRRVSLALEMPVLLVDAAESLLMLGQKKAPDGEAAHDFAVHVTLEPCVAALRARWDGVWARAGA